VRPAEQEVTPHLRSRKRRRARIAAMTHPGERTRKAPRPPHALGSYLPSPVACEVCCWSGVLDRARRKCTPDRAVAGGAVASAGPQDNRSYGDGPEVTLTSAHRLLADLAHGRCRARPGRGDRRPGEDPGEGPVQPGRDGYKAMLAAGRRRPGWPAPRRGRLTEAMRGTLEPEETPGGGLTMAISVPAAPRPAEHTRRARQARARGDRADPTGAQIATAPCPSMAPE
jgi:hypothetical protein